MTDPTTAATERVNGVTAMLATMDLPKGAAMVTDMDEFATALANVRRAEVEFSLESAQRGVDWPAVTLVVQMPMTTGGLMVAVRVNPTGAMTSWATRRLAELLTAVAGAVDALENGV